jgi:hypothetical protein
MIAGGRTPIQMQFTGRSRYDGPGTAEVLPPKPLGRMARKLQEIAALPVEQRPVDLYAALAEVAR